MSRTIRNSKSGEKVKDGFGRYKCRCSYCMGVTKRKSIKETYDKEIEDTITDFYGDVTFNWEIECERIDKAMFWTELQDERNWIEYQSAA